MFYSWLLYTAKGHLENLEKLKQFIKFIRHTLTYSNNKVLRVIRVQKSEHPHGLI